MRATYTRTEGVRHVLAALELGEDKKDRAVCWCGAANST
jgi:hypothetical protein